MNDLTNLSIEELEALLEKAKQEKQKESCKNNGYVHPAFGLRCLVRTYSAGVHIGDVTWINPENAMECKLENALRLWSWEDGGLSLSAIANNGVVKARLNETGTVFLTNCVEYIPTTKKAEKTYVKFIEDKE